MAHDGPVPTCITRILCSSLACGPVSIWWHTTGQCPHALQESFAAQLHVDRCHRCCSSLVTSGQSTSGIHGQCPGVHACTALNLGWYAGLSAHPLVYIQVLRPKYQTIVTSLMLVSSSCNTYSTFISQFTTQLHGNKGIQAYCQPYLYGLPVVGPCIQCIAPPPPPPPTYSAHLIRVPFHRTPPPTPTHTHPLPTLPNFIGHPLGMLPSPQLIPPTLNLLPPPPPLIQNTTQDIAQLISHTSTSSAGASHTVHTAANLSSQHMVGHGLPPVSKKLADRILAGEFVDLAELPPAKGKVRPLQSPEGGVLFISAHDLLQQKRLIPDLATWVQCFSLYTAIIC